MFRLLLLVYVMILDKIYFWKISTEDDIEKINYLGRQLARLGRGFQTRPQKYLYLPYLNLLYCCLIWRTQKNWP